MLIELYGPVFQSNSSPLTPEQISITQGIFNSLLVRTYECYCMAIVYVYGYIIEKCR